jgi:hypothetical protein
VSAETSLAGTLERTLCSRIPPSCLASTALRPALFETAVFNSHTHACTSTRPPTNADNSSTYTITSRSSSGGFVTLSTKLTGTCAGHYSTPDADAVLAATATDASTWVFSPSAGPPPPPSPPPPGPETVTVRLGDVTHVISPLVLGCHSDSGYAHAARGFYSQMVVGDSFTANGCVHIRCPTQIVLDGESSTTPLGNRFASTTL